MDATLYYAPFAEAARAIWGADCPPTRDVPCWLWYKEYLTDTQWREIITFVHDRLGVYKPFPNAVEVLQSVQDDFEIIVTSQRDPHYKRMVDFWLATWHIPANSTVIRTENKAELFKPGDIVIDDAPHNIADALKRGARVVSLRYPYNAETEWIGAVLVEDWEIIGQYLKEVLPYVERQCIKRDS
jgi:beta-phosphoglucomutase-like phosphatase (HAD superfamily)